MGFVSSDDSRHFVTTVAGAESNLAAALATLGCRVRWVSRVGADALGRLIVREVEGRGVDVVVERDPIKPTGVLVRHVSDGHTSVRYYRSDSAARGLGPGAIDLAGTAAWCHFTGITPAVSTSAADLVMTICDRAGTPAGNLSFDVNFRPALWADAATAAETLLQPARRADVVFVGDDESEALFGTTDTGELAHLLLHDDGQELVLKRGRGPASLVTRSDVVTEPGADTVVVDPTGAGDAFAAGYLAGRISGLPPRRRLRLAHFMGARAVGALDDAVRPLSEVEFEELVSAGLVRRREAREV